MRVDRMWSKRFIVLGGNSDSLSWLGYVHDWVYSYERTPGVITTQTQLISFSPRTKPFYTGSKYVRWSLKKTPKKKKLPQTRNKTIQVIFFNIFFLNLPPQALSQQTRTASLDRLNFCRRPLGPLEPSRQLTPIKILAWRRLHTPKRLARMPTNGAIIWYRRWWWCCWWGGWGRWGGGGGRGAGTMTAEGPMVLRFGSVLDKWVGEGVSWWSRMCLGGWVGGFYIGEQKIDNKWLEDDCLVFFIYIFF